MITTDNKTPSPIALMLVLLFVSTAISAQSPGIRTTTAQDPQVRSHAAATTDALPMDQAPPLYGVQGVLIETLDSRTIASQAPEIPLNPASAVKLATALVALRSLGPEHRFSTGVWTNGSIERTSGTINGNLYISGRDPSFHDEHAVIIAEQLNKLGIRTVTGNLIVAPLFTMNFRRSARRSGERLYDTLDATLRPTEASASWNYVRAMQRVNVGAAPVPSVAVMGEVLVKPVDADAKLLFTHQSSRLTDVLKVLLCYSNNFMAERLGDSLGGVRSVERKLNAALPIPAGEFKLSSLSGLGANRVTPRAMMIVFRALREELRKHRLSTTDIMPVAGIDPGTLQDRFTDPASRGSVIAKTGTLIRTDGGASSLVGQMRTASGETLLFVIFNQRGSVLRFRDNQDFMIKQVQASRGGPSAFFYSAQPLTMKLTDTRSRAAESQEEYEPVVAEQSSP